MKPSVGHIRSTFTFKLLFAEKEAPHRAKLVGQGTGAASVVDLQVNFVLEESGGSTKVLRDGEATLGCCPECFCQQSHGLSGIPQRMDHEYSHVTPGL